MIQGRTSNQRNEITDINESCGLAWIAPLYNRAGKMTRAPKPVDPRQYYTCTYDAWNRLVKVKEGTDTVAEYQYDGAKRRTVKMTYSGGQLEETRHFFYTEPARWQVIEELLEESGSLSSDPDRQFIWGIRYVDDLVLRDRDTTGDGTLDQRLYALQDANWNVTSIAGTTGAIQERYAYTAYRTPHILTPTFTPRSTSNHAWETLFAGYRFDTQTQLYHIRNRMYAPALGWLQRDPLGYADLANLYLYVRANRAGRLDPRGMLEQQGYWYCRTACEDHCYELYYRSGNLLRLWQYMWCVDACGEYCQRGSYNPLCRFVTAFGDECMQDLTQCLCFIFGDVVSWAPGPVGCAAGVFECFCELLMFAQIACTGAGQDGEGLSQGYIGALDCALNIAVCLFPGFRLFANPWNAVFEFAEQMLLLVLEEHKTDPHACWDWIQGVRCGKCGWFGSTDGARWPAY